MDNILYLIAFEQTHAALEAEELLINSGIRARIAPLPAEVSAGCGFCVVISPADKEHAEATLKAGGLACFAVYQQFLNIK